MIRNFRDRETELVFRGQRSRRLPPNIQRSAYEKLVMIDAAVELDRLAFPPGNRLERLSGDRVDQYSIRINNRWRICFTWSNGIAEDVEITDYH